ncbi:rhomboid family intramembrane serine protease [Marinicella litoralis]|uniref:Membrane associated rhomboid family serine protease n=1 Tax=Marinicella litoralis TaxID=644220 RepID=A0A4R6XW99_9GAMM|nr:rhomboid family intramembrane serine protease [Marinicella litoralis]TDR22514.1 membrane associated rhomboid family serine protease [Marinicella litoralis]
MIIVPTEKRFDWQNAPLALFVIVIINVLVFYAYQTGDSDHFEEALRIYVGEGIYQKELPHYRDFLEQGGDAEKIALFKEMERMRNNGYAAAFILQDEPFYVYMSEHGEELFEPGYHEYWLYQREHMHELMFEVSYKKHGLIANDIQITSLITHQFLHGGTMHLIGNMFFLIICGFAVEASLGHKKFILFYLLTGVGGGLAQALMDLNSSTPLIGASGAVSGVMAMYLGIFRLRKIEFFYWFFVFVGYFRAPALFILPFYIGNELISLWTQPEANVAFMAHVGGFVTGAVLIGLVVWRKPETLNHEYIEQDQTATPVQLSLQELYQSMDKFKFDSALNQLDEHIAAFGADFNLKILKYKLLRAVKPEQAQSYFNQIINGSRPNKQQVSKIEKVWQGLSKGDKQLETEAQYKLAWHFITVPEYIEHAIYLFEQMYQAENKHHSLNVLAKKISSVFKQLDNRLETEKYMNLAKELS